MNVSQAYGEVLSREPRFQVIEKIDGLSASGATASVRTTQPSNWMPSDSGGESHWLFDPGLLDAAAQMICLWTGSYLSENVVPTNYGRIVRYSERLPARLRMEFTRNDSPGPEHVRGDVVVFDDQGTVVLAIEDLDCTLRTRTEGAVANASATLGVQA
jgi:hypothetical protein